MRILVARCNKCDEVCDLTREAAAMLENFCECGGKFLVETLRSNYDRSKSAGEFPAGFKSVSS